MSYSRRGCVIGPLEGDRPPPVRIEEPFSAMTFSSDEKYLVTVQKASTKERGAGLYLLKRRNAAGYPIEASAWFHDDTYNDDVHLAVSRNGRYAAVAAGGVPLKLYTLADMKLIKETPLPHWCRNYTGQMVCTGHIESMAFSPDNKLLAVGQESRPRPRFFDPTSGDELFPYEGHGSYVVDLRFSADGRVLRSIGSDGSICTWDAGTMKMLTRSALPTGRFLANIRPSDGRYGLCPVAVIRTNLPSSWTWKRARPCAK